ncbi:hypothetical protein CK203_105096 [Vitis vinifera]|uniref:Uncharacterized protein n=1 Tax=Vitis vinifera TaxID=29760 RepID=A0A438CNQ1_VITVI|nr:hypothetical protein CK203_105096 [Vitis vinifera]
MTFDESISEYLSLDCTLGVLDVAHLVLLGMAILFLPDYSAHFTCLDSLLYIGFGCTHTITVHASRLLSVESLRGFTIGKPPGMRGSACVEVMTTLHGSAPSLRRRAEVAYRRRDEFEYGRTAHLHLDALLVPVQIIFSSIHSPSHILIPFFVLCRIGPLFFVLIYLCGSEQRRSTFRIRIFTLSLGIVSWIIVEGKLVRVSDTPDMDQQVVMVDQFTAAMASIQEALASLRQEIGGQQGRPPTVQDETPYDSHPPPPPPPVPSVHQASPYVLHEHSEIAPPVVAQAVVADDTHARMDRIEQCMRQMRVSDGSVVWDDFGGMPVASLPAKFRMPDIERYTGIGCPRLHLRLIAP